MNDCLCEIGNNSGYLHNVLEMIKGGINSSAWEFLPEKGHRQPKGVPPSLSHFLPLYLGSLRSNSPSAPFCLLLSHLFLLLLFSTGDISSLQAGRRADSKTFQSQLLELGTHHSPSATVGRSERSGWVFPECFPQPARLSHKLQSRTVPWAFPPGILSGRVRTWWAF